MEEILEESQARAAAAPGPVMVVAGPGTGKTTVLTARVARLAREGHYNVLAITFTRRAAGEMRRRLSRLLGDAIDLIAVSTLHALGYRLIREMGEVLGIPSGSKVIPPHQALGVLEEAAEALGLEFPWPLATIYGIISRAKRRLQTPGDVAQDLGLEQVSLLWEQYQALLLHHGQLDYGDLIVFLTKLLLHPEAGPLIRERFGYVLVDEFQDISRAQFQAICLLGDGADLFGVGSAAQAIYGWREAEPSIMATEFFQAFPGARRMALRRNYRSTPQILEAAQGLIRGHGYLEEGLLPTREDGPPVRLVFLDDEAVEAEFISAEIAGILGRDGTGPGDIAVLARTRSRLRLIEQGLMRGDIPYIVAGDTTLLDTEEARDLLAYLRLAVDPGNPCALARICNRPRRFASPGNLEGLEGVTLASLADAIGHAEEKLRSAVGPAREVWEREKEALLRFWDFLEELDRRGRENPPAGELLNWILLETGYEAWLREMDPLGYHRRLGNLNAFRDFVTQGGERVKEFVEGIELALGEGYIPLSADGVTLSTIHAAKGLEWRVVFLAGLEEQVLPHVRSADIEEERRLLYVAMTRARDELYLTCTRRRPWSRFLADLPRGVLEVQRK